MTGVVVNEKLSINRKELKNFRALLYQIEQSGFEGKSWHGKSENLLSAIRGYAHFINMVDKSKGKKYITQIEAISKKYSNHTKPKDIETPPQKEESFIDNILNMFRK